MITMNNPNLQINHNPNATNNAQEFVAFGCLFVDSN